MLARKWRPANFSEVAGQAHVLKTLINALDNERLHHAYLFAGTRGVGKTTLARILAKCLNCEEGVTSTPCGECKACVQIKEGRFIDLIEVDAASRTKVEDTRELLENVQYSPAGGRFKVYLIDEVHMLSNHSFNALLKTLEEPPPHVKFLFATTDPQKLPITILSRCLQFNLKELRPGTIVSFLTSVLDKEGVRFDEDGIWQIATAAEGSMRDALTLLDQGISYCQGAIESEGIVEMLGIPKKDQIFALLESMATNEIADMIEISNRISGSAPDYKFILENLLSTLHRLAIAQLLPDSVDNSLGDKEKVLKLSKIISTEDVQLYYQIGSKGREELRFAIDAKSTFEMVLIRMVVFSPMFEIGDRINMQPDVKKKDSLRVSERLSGVDTKIHDSIQNQSVSLTLEVNNKPIQIPKKQEDSTTRKKAINPKEKQLNDLASHDDWLLLYFQFNFRGIVNNVMSNTEFIKNEGKVIYFLLSKELSSIYNKDMLPKIHSALGEFIKDLKGVNITLGATHKETPAMMKKRLKLETHKYLQDEFEQDSNVQELVKHFSGKIAKESIFSTKE